MKIVPATSWLFPEERSGVVEMLIEMCLLKFDNARSLKLKSGGSTDIYINLRDARNLPAAIEYLAKVYERPLRLLETTRFVEVPDSVSCFAGPLSLRINQPYLTIREQAKEGRVAKAKVIGSPKKGEVVDIIDDVITDGESKIVPYQECLAMGLNVRSLIVLVDRQQGWRKKFVDNKIALPLWPGMDLHDVRRYLVDSGMMQRCKSLAETKNPIIVALDGKSWDELLPIIDPLRTTGCILKVNDLMFARGFDNLVPDLNVYGRVMVDLKCHDIPNTVGNTCKRLAVHKPWAVTVHGSGSEEMIQAAVKALEGSGTSVLVVTVLTSLDEKTCEEVYMRRPWDQVLKLAEIAQRAGAQGLVCSPQEVQELHRLYPGMILVTPGIRSEDVSADDQKRIATPKGAIDSGSNYLVMGRQILNAKDPVAEVNRVLVEELGIAV